MQITVREEDQTVTEHRVTDAQGVALSDRLIRVVKLMQALRSSAPRIHPAVEQTSHPLLAVLRRGPTRVTELAELIHSDASVVSRQVRHLESLDLVSRTSDPEDGRASLVGLTEYGTALMDEFRAGRGAWFARMLADWDPDDVDHLEHRLALLADAFERELRDRTTPTTDKETT